MKHSNIIARDTTNTPITPKSINIGLSACLAGQKVRYNGGHTRSNMCVNLLSKYFQFHTFCPEVSAGFGTPRPTMRLVGETNSPQLQFSNSDSNEDLTDKLTAGFSDALPQMADLDGYILMKNSPSCGMERVKVYRQNGHPHQIRTAGVFAKALQTKYPLMPVEEEGRLNDDRLFDNFIARVYAYNNFKKDVLATPTMHNLLQFHSSYKYLLMAHNQNSCRALGRILANHEHLPLSILVTTYFKTFIATLSTLSTRKNHTNALQHIAGYLKKSVPSAARKNISDIIYKYKQGLIPLSTPVTLISHYINQYGSRYIQAQRYLQPYPEAINPIRKHCY